MLVPDFENHPLLEGNLEKIMVNYTPYFRIFEGKLTEKHPYFIYILEEIMVKSWQKEIIVKYNPYFWILEGRMTEKHPYFMDISGDFPRTESRN